MLIEFPAGGKKPPFEQLYEDYYQPLLKYLRGKTGNLQDAEDLTAETFLYCYRNYDSYDPEKSKPSTWLYLVANSRLKNHYRDRKETVEFETLENLLEAEETDMDRAVALEQLRLALAKKLELLPERQQKVVVMRFFQEKEFYEIAETLGTSVGNVRVMLSRALDRLGKEMSEFKEDWGM